nr:MAG TPA: hypothetical protein [Caudoviricetes sp.]
MRIKLNLKELRKLGSFYITKDNNQKLGNKLKR